MLIPSRAVISYGFVYTHMGHISVFILLFAESIHTMSQKKCKVILQCPERHILWEHAKETLCFASAAGFESDASRYRRAGTGRVRIN